MISRFKSNPTEIDSMAQVLIKHVVLTLSKVNGIMSREGSSRGSGNGEPPARGLGSAISWELRPFKLRFAPQRQLGRSYVSATKPLGIPAVITENSHRAELEDASQAERVERALSRVTIMFERGPREKYPHPVTTAQQYGWWWDCKQVNPLVGDQQLQHHIRDSAWLKERVRVLATDASYKRL